MPTYQYSCTDCGHFFEIFQSFSDDSLTVCPECTGRLRKVFNAVGVVFKGSGFYRNDSRGKQPGADGGAESGSSTAPDARPDGKPDTKDAKPAVKGSSDGTSASKSGSESGTKSGTKVG